MDYYIVRRIRLIVVKPPPPPPPGDNIKAFLILCAAIVGLIPLILALRSFY
jgi:hypothetical protein